MSSNKEEIEKLEQQVEEIRRRRNGKRDMKTPRLILNITYLILAAVGVTLYFVMPDRHIIGITIVGVAMVLKVIEFFLRFMF